VALSLLLVEAVLRLAAPESFLVPQVPLGLQFLRWNAFRGMYLEAGHSIPGVLSINDEGRRGPRLDPARRRRLVCLGDSSTFGIWSGGGSDLEDIRFDNYPALLARSMERAGYDSWQVVNAGVPGSHAGHSLRILRREILSLEPEIVTLRVGVNDHARSRLPWYDDPESAPLRRLFYGLGGSRIFLLAIEAHHRLTRDPDTPRRMMSVDAFRQALEAIVAESRTHGIHLLLMDYPLRLAAPSDQTARGVARFYGERTVQAFFAVHAAYQGVVASVAREQGVPLLATAPTLLDPERPGFHIDVVHPDRRGMRQTAALLLRDLEARGWLGARSSAGSP
jgi:lysophospholipase L1-like esterase